MKKIGWSAQEAHNGALYRSGVELDGGSLVGITIPNNVVDDFEDGNISEYSGGTNEFSVVQSRTYNGDYALYSTAGSSHTITAGLNDGLENVPERGDTFYFAFYITNDYRDMRLFWSDGDYGIWRRGVGWDSGNGGEFRLYTPSGVSEVEPNNYSVPINEWGIVQVDFGDPVKAELYVAENYPNGSPEVSVSRSDTSGADSGDITWYANSNGTGEQWYDAFYTSE